MTLGTFPLLLTSLPQTGAKWLEFTLLSLFFAFLLMVLFTQHRLTTARKPKPPPHEEMR